MIGRSDDHRKRWTSCLTTSLGARPPLSGVTVRVRIHDHPGRETPLQVNTPLVLLYGKGNVARVFIVEHVHFRACRRPVPASSIARKPGMARCVELAPRTLERCERVLRDPLGIWRHPEAEPMARAISVQRPRICCRSSQVPDEWRQASRAVLPTRSRGERGGVPLHGTGGGSSRRSPRFRVTCTQPQKFLVLTGIKTR